MRREAVRLVITCEHGGYDVPQQFNALFKGNKKLLKSHISYDPGAVELATLLHRTFGAPLFISTISRLICDTNRSPHNPRVFSSITRLLGSYEKDHILKHYYESYRNPVESSITNSVMRKDRIIHIAVHTFTPVLRGCHRSVDVAFLYDPRRYSEQHLCKLWKKSLQKQDVSLIVRRNYPYLGSTDGLTTFFRNRFPDTGYIGIELEINQSYPLIHKGSWAVLQSALLASLGESIAQCGYHIESNL